MKHSGLGHRCWLPIVALLATAAGPRANFYDPPSLATHHHPGDILRSEPFPGAPAGSSATRMLYVSTAPNGRAIAVSALVIVPSGVAPAQGRPVLAWLHPTTGVARACAPTLGPDPFGQIQGLSAFIAAGDVVVATDYPGLGGRACIPIWWASARHARRSIWSAPPNMRPPRKLVAALPCGGIRKVATPRCSPQISRRAMRRSWSWSALLRRRPLPTCRR